MRAELKRNHLSRGARLAAFLLCSATPAALLAQSDPAAVPAPVSAAVEARLAAQRDLTQALGLIAANPADLFALSQAGRAALALGDARTAIGFLARAEALAPRDPVIKAAMGAALVQLEDPQQAMRYFESAISLGGLDRAYMGDRGLAFDLLGDQVRAQADYAVAARTHPSDELTRRHAISLGISGQADAAVQMLGPLLRAQDRAAWRSRAMILAMNGRADEARQIARATMPRQLAEGLEPYFALMDRLTPGQLAAASHFGHFPSYDTLQSQPSRMAAAAPAPPPVATPTPAPSARGRRTVAATRTANRAEAGAGAVRSPRRTVVAAATPTPAPAVVTPPSSSPPISAAPPPPPPPAPAPVIVSAPVVQPLPTPTPAPAPTAAPVAIPGPTPPAAPIVVAANTSPPVLPPTVVTRTPVPDPAPAPSPTPTLATPTPAATPSAAVPVAAASAAPSSPPVYGPVDLPPSGVSVERPVASRPPVLANVAVAPSSVAESATSDGGMTGAPTASAAPVTAPPPASPAAAASSSADVRLSGWSLDDMIASIEIPESERQASAAGLSLDEVAAIAADQRARQAEAAAAARQEARLEAQREAEARRRAEADAAARAEAERVRRHPARIWVQVATGADVAALGFDCRRLTRQYSASFAGQSCSSAVWNRTRRLVVGPFRNAAAARSWLAAYSAAGGDGFVWSSDAGEEVTPVGRSR